MDSKPASEKPFSFLDAFAQSIVRRDWYRQAARIPTRSAVRYTLLLFLLTGTLTGAKHAMDAHAFLGDLAENIPDDFPTLTVEKGKARADGPQPRKITSRPLTLVIDTTGRQTSLGEDVLDGFFVSADRVLVKRSGYEAEALRFSDLPDTTITRQAILRLLDGARTAVFPLAIAGSLALTLVVKPAHLLLVSPFAFLINWRGKQGWKPPEIFRMGVFALTPALLADTFLTVTDLHGPVTFGFPLAVLAWYWAFGLTAPHRPAAVAS